MAKKKSVINQKVTEEVKDVEENTLEEEVDDLIDKSFAIMEHEFHQETNVVYTIAGFIIIIIVIVIAAYGWYIHDMKIDRCTEITSATLYDSGQISREMAPYHGGAIYTETIYTDYYECTINGERHTAIVQSYQPLPNIGIIDVYYNPNNPEEYFLDKDVFNNNYLIYTDNWDSKTSSDKGYDFIFK